MNEDGDGSGHHLELMNTLALSHDIVGDLAETIAQHIRDIDGGSKLSRDGLGTLVMRRLYDLGIICLDQVREVGQFVADNANMVPSELAEALVTEFHFAEKGS